jgi:hypothetical protein
MKAKAKKGLEALRGKNVLLMCGNYHYAGKIADVSDDDVQLEGAAIVYETGAWSNAPKWADAQKLPGKVWYVTRASIESFGEV